MTGTDFYDAIAAHPTLELRGIVAGELRVAHPPTGALWSLTVAGVKAIDWETLESVLTGRRDAEIISHQSRIVGYYSTFKLAKPDSILNNWNRSKLGEMEARRRGDYIIS